MRGLGGVGGHGEMGGPGQAGNGYGDNVIDMTEMRNDMRFGALNQVEAYWQALRRGGDVPNRSDIDPRGIESALEYAFILEKIAPGLARLRIAGMHLSDLMGMEVRGMPISSFVPPEGRTRFAETLEEVTTAPAIARLHMSAETGIGKPALHGQMLLMPLKSDLGDIARVLGCFETIGPIGRAPRRFTVTRTELTRLEDMRGATPAPAADLAARRGRHGAPGTSAAQTGSQAGSQASSQTGTPAGAGIVAPGFAEPQAPFTGQGGAAQGGTARARGGQGKPRPSYLRLVKSDE